MTRWKSDSHAASEALAWTEAMAPQSLGPPTRESLLPCPEEEMTIEILERGGSALVELIRVIAHNELLALQRASSPDPQWLTIAEAAQRLGCSAQTRCACALSAGV